MKKVLDYLKNWRGYVTENSLMWVGIFAIAEISYLLSTWLFTGLSSLIADAVCVLFISGLFFPLLKYIVLKIKLMVSDTT
jgi:hypothetical protein